MMTSVSVHPAIVWPPKYGSKIRTIICDSNHRSNQQLTNLPHWSPFPLFWTTSAIEYLSNTGTRGPGSHHHQPDGTTPDLMDRTNLLARASSSTMSDLMAQANQTTIPDQLIKANLSTFLMDLWPPLFITWFFHYFSCWIALFTSPEPCETSTWPPTAGYSHS